MKTFSILLALVCIGFVLMLAGNATAQTKISFEAEVEEAVIVEREYEVGDTIPFTITLRRNGVVRPSETIVFEVLGLGDSKGVVQINDPNAATVTPPDGITNVSGRVATMVTFNRAHETLYVVIRATAPNFVDATYNQAFAVRSEETAVRIVADPDVGDGLAVGDTFTYAIEARNVEDLAAYQMDIVFNPNVLSAGAVTEGDFLETGGWDAFHHESSGGKISLSQARINRTQDADGAEVLAALAKGDGVSGSGTLATIEFTLLEFAEEAIGLHNVQLSDSEGKRISYATLVHPAVATHMFPAEDVNRDGTVNVLDLTVVAGSLGQASPINPRADVNDDSIVNALDLVMVAQKLGTSTPAVKVRDANDAAAPAANAGNLRPETVQGWIDIARVEDDGSAVFDLGIANLERLLQSAVPEKTRLLLNYPNPFNPETWIPYQLAKATDVTVSIYSVNGSLVRTLALGHQAAGVYQSKSQAAYWDGRNEFGEQVASGVYFYTLTAGDFSATGKMLVRK